MGNEDRSRECHPVEASHRCRDAQHGSGNATPVATLPMQLSIPGRGRARRVGALGSSRAALGVRPPAFPAHGGVAEQRKQPPVKRPPCDPQVRVLPPPPERPSRNGQACRALNPVVRVRVPGGARPAGPFRRSPPADGAAGARPRSGAWSPRRPVTAKTASSNLVGAATGAPGAGTWRARACGEPTRFESGRSARAGLGVRLSRPPHGCTWRDTQAGQGAALEWR